MGLSVVVTIVDGGAALVRCLRGLAAQEGAPSLEVLIPYDDSVSEVARLAEDFADFRFVDLGSLPTARSVDGPAGQHELYDRRRAAGLAAAGEDLVAIIEDRGVPRPDWARSMVQAHVLPHAVIGGAVENGCDRLLNWAVYFCDYSRYQLPVSAGPVDYLSDVNVCYKRAALESTRHLWRERYHETTVHWALQRAGETLYLSAEPVVDQIRDGLALGPLLRERFAWGRLFGYTRVGESDCLPRAILALLAPLLPGLLLARQLRLRIAKRRDWARFALASPCMLLLLLAWSLGELFAYVTGEA